MNPALGRFLQRDPQLGSSCAGIFEPMRLASLSPQELNGYSYMQNNAVNFTDPMGLRRMGGISVTRVFNGITGSYSPMDAAGSLYSYGGYSAGRNSSTKGTGHFTVIVDSRTGQRIDPLASPIDSSKIIVQWSTPGGSSQSGGGASFAWIPPGTQGERVVSFHGAGAEATSSILTKIIKEKLKEALEAKAKEKLGGKTLREAKEACNELERLNKDNPDWPITCMLCAVWKCYMESYMMPQLDSCIKTKFIDCHSRIKP